MRRFLFAWRHALASEAGPQRPTDRLVGMTLALYFNGDGIGAWPSQETLARRTGLTTRSIRPALARLVRDDWLGRIARKGPKGIRAPRWGFEYRAKLPRKLSNQYANGENVSLFAGKAPTAAISKKNGEIDDRGIGNRFPPNTSGELVKGVAFKRNVVIPSAQELDSFVADLDASQFRQ